MKKVFYILGITSFLFFEVWCYAGEQVAVSVIFPSDVEAYNLAWNGFREFFTANKVSLEISRYNLTDDDPAEIYSRIIKEKPDLVVTLGSKASKLARERIKDIPVVFCMVFNPLEIAGSNITGVSMEISTKIKLQEIRRILPHAKKIGLVYSPELSETYKNISKMCDQMGFKPIGEQIESEKDFSMALKNIFKHIDCFLMISDSKIYSPLSVKHLLLQSLREKIPVVGLSSLYTKAGALFSVDCDYEDLGQQTAKISLRVLNGEKPTDIRPAIPRKTKLFLNQLAADRLGIKIQDQIIKEASEVF